MQLRAARPPEPRRRTSPSASLSGPDSGITCHRRAHAQQQRCTGDVAVAREQGDQNRPARGAASARLGRRRAVARGAVARQHHRDSARQRGDVDVVRRGVDGGGFIIIVIGSGSGSPQPASATTIIVTKSLITLRLYSIHRKETNRSHGSWRAPPRRRVTDASRAAVGLHEAASALSAGEIAERPWHGTLGIGRALAAPPDARIAPLARVGAAIVRVVADAAQTRGAAALEHQRADALGAERRVQASPHRCVTASHACPAPGHCAALTHSTQRRLTGSQLENGAAQSPSPRHSTQAPASSSQRSAARPAQPPHGSPASGGPASPAPESGGSPESRGSWPNLKSTRAHATSAATSPIATRRITSPSAPAPPPRRARSPSGSARDHARAAAAPPAASRAASSFMRSTSALSARGPCGHASIRCSNSATAPAASPWRLSAAAWAKKCSGPRGSRPRPVPRPRSTRPATVRRRAPSPRARRTSPRPRPRRPLRA